MKLRNTSFTTFINPLKVEPSLCREVIITGTGMVLSHEYRLRKEVVSVSLSAGKGREKITFRNYNCHMSWWYDRLNEFSTIYISSNKYCICGQINYNCDEGLRNDNLSIFPLRRNQLIRVNWLIYFEDHSSWKDDLEKQRCLALSSNIFGSI